SQQQNVRRSESTWNSQEPSESTEPASPFLLSTRQSIDLDRTPRSGRHPPVQRNTRLSSRHSFHNNATRPATAGLGWRPVNGAVVDRTAMGTEYLDLSRQSLAR